MRLDDLFAHFIKIQRVVRMITVPVEDFLHFNGQHEDLVTLSCDPIEFFSWNLNAIHYSESFMIDIELRMGMLLLEHGADSVKKFLLELRMRYCDEGVCPLSHVFPVE